MSYIGISVKEAMQNINRDWFLPAVQRPYVWGCRYESEKYICKLFDSLYRSYPIGGLIMWRTKEPVAHREFLQDYHQGDIYKNVDDGLWGRDKFLIYDGQQRLQTLFSCLKYSFNDRILVFDLSYDPEQDEDSDTGFKFIDASAQCGEFEIKMNKLFSSLNDTKYKRQLRESFQLKTEDKHVKDLIEDNWEQLWRIFVENDAKSLAYFSIESNNEDKVNEIFERLNTGGIPLSKADLLFSRIKSKFPEFESDIMNFSKALAIRTHLSFQSYDILQVLHMIVKCRYRINEQVNDQQIDCFQEEWNGLKEPLNSLFDDYLRNHLHISHMAIIRNKTPLLVLAVFFREFYRIGMSYRNMTAQTLQQIDKFFILAEFNDWTLQSYADNFCRIIKDNVDKTTFPYDSLVEYVRIRGNRPIELTERMFRGYRWMALKFLMRSREFEFDNTMLHRFNPELDHIFPVNLPGQDDEYRKYVDVVWNMQPVKGEANNLKSNIHPLEFFTDNAKNKSGENINGSKYFCDYDFVPELTDPSWNNYKSFIPNRKEMMIKAMHDFYSIDIIPDEL